MSERPTSPEPTHDGVRRATQTLSWVFVLGFLILVGIARGVYSAHELPPSARFELLAFVGYLTFVWHWIRQECEPNGVTFPMDLAWFMSLLWVVLAPYYLWRGQRWRGLAKFAVLVAAWVIAYGLTAATHYTVWWLG